MNPRYFHVLLEQRRFPPNGEVKRGQIESAMGFVEMKNFSFGMFNYKTKLFKKIRKNIVAIKKDDY